METRRFAWANIPPPERIFFMTPQSALEAAANAEGVWDTEMHEIRVRPVHLDRKPSRQWEASVVLDHGRFVRFLREL